MGRMFSAGGAPPPVGDECFQGGFPWAFCCFPETRDGGDERCWDDIHTFERCCHGALAPSESWFDQSVAEPLAQCLTQLGPIVLTPLRECKIRYYHLAVVVGMRAETSDLHRPWWDVWLSPVDPVHHLHLTQPQKFRYLGGLCVPEACSWEAVSAWVAPRFAPHWRHPARVPHHLNATHVRLPPALALRRSYPDF